MATDIEKLIERAKRYLEKNKIQDAIDAYQSVLSVSPGQMEAVQALGDLYTQRGDAGRAAIYYGMIFDRLNDPHDESKAIAVYTRFLRAAEQPPERQSRYAILLHKQHRIPEAVENYSAAAERFLLRGRDDDALKCLEQVAELAPEDEPRQIELAELAEKRGKPVLAVRGYVRVGKIALARRETLLALEMMSNARRVAPDDRDVALLSAQAMLMAGDPAGAAVTLEPFMGSDVNPAFQRCLGEALMRSGQLDRATEPLTSYYQHAGADHALLFDLAERYAAANQDAKAVELLTGIRQNYRDSAAQQEFALRLDRIAQAHSSSLPIVEFWSQVYSGLNRESRYFEVLVHLFDVYLQQGNVKGACDVLDRMVDIDPYDYRNQQRLERLRGHADDDHVSRVAARLGVTLVSGEGEESSQEGGTSASAGSAQPREITLDDLLVQAEIFLQYSLHPKAVERLEKIAQLYPGEDERNERYRNLCDAAKWWPPGFSRNVGESPSNREPERTASTPASRSGDYTAETLRDLAKISEIGQSIYRQASPNAMLTLAVNEAGKHLRAARCLAVIGAAGQPPQFMAEFRAPGLEPATAAQVTDVVKQMDRAAPDALGGLPMDSALAPMIRNLGLATALGVVLVDKETQVPAGMIIAGHAAPHRWKPDETYFLNAVGDQTLLSVNHTRLRSLVQTLHVADEKTGLLARSSYADRLLGETHRAKLQGAPLSLIILQIDRGPEMIRQQGEALVEKSLEHVARAVLPLARPNDLSVKYTAWSLALILPDTTLGAALGLTEKMREAAAAKGANGTEPLTLSAGVVEAVARVDYDNEDIVTELINRAEMSLDEARKRGGDTVVSLAEPRI
jgi:diguanylate cyclase (GGDEF)-like protein